MSNYAVFNTAGEIILMLTVPDTASAAAQPLAVENDFLGVDDEVTDTEYFIDVINRIPLLKQDYTLESLPIPCTATIEGVEYQLTEQPTFEFPVLPEPMSYTVSIDAGVQYLKKEFVIDVDPS